MSDTIPAPTPIKVRIVDLSDDTGDSRPVNCMAGVTVRIAVPNSAASWVWAKHEMNSP